MLELHAGPSHCLTSYHDYLPDVQRRSSTTSDYPTRTRLERRNRSSSSTSLFQTQAEQPQVGQRVCLLGLEWGRLVQKLFEESHRSTTRRRGWPATMATAHKSMAWSVQAQRSSRGGHIAGLLVVQSKALLGRLALGAPVAVGQLVKGLPAARLHAQGTAQAAAQRSTA